MVIEAKPKSIEERIRAAYEPGISYHTLALKVFPPKEYPKSWRYAGHGGPPACYRSLSAALRKLGARYVNVDGSARDVILENDG